MKSFNTYKKAVLLISSCLALGGCESMANWAIEQALTDCRSVEVNEKVWVNQSGVEMREADESYKQLWEQTRNEFRVETLENCKKLVTDSVNLFPPNSWDQGARNDFISSNNFEYLKKACVYRIKNLGYERDMLSRDERQKLSKEKLDKYREEREYENLFWTMEVKLSELYREKFKMNANALGYSLETRKFPERQCYTRAFPLIK